MDEVTRVNSVLAKLNSEHRAQVGDTVNGALIALFEAIPAYVDQQVKEQIAALAVASVTVVHKTENTHDQENQG